MRVAVLGGGRSSEHEVSLASAASVRGGLEAAGHEVVAVDLARDGTWRCGGEEVVLRAGRGLLGCDVAFPVLHGPFGEDGTVQGLLELLDVPYVGSGVMASAVCLDKVVFKDLMSAVGLPQVAYALAVAGRPLPDLDALLARLGLPVWVKPARLGSSVGIQRVDAAAGLRAALEDAFAYDPRVIIEATAPGVEVECSVLGPTEDPRASEPGRIVTLTGTGWYDYEAKYTEGGMTLEVPAGLPEAIVERVRALAVTAFTAAGCSGLARADFFVDGDDVLLNELNTLPGFTRTSVYGALWEASGVPYPQLVDALCRIAIDRAAAEKAFRF